MGLPVHLEPHTFECSEIPFCIVRASSKRDGQQRTVEKNINEGNTRSTTFRGVQVGSEGEHVDGEIGDPDPRILLDPKAADDITHCQRYNSNTADIPLEPWTGFVFEKRKKYRCWGDGNGMNVGEVTRVRTFPVGTPEKSQHSVKYSVAHAQVQSVERSMWTHVRAG